MLKKTSTFQINLSKIQIKKLSSKNTISITKGKNKKSITLAYKVPKKVTTKINYLKPSENKSYPKLSSHKHFYLKVSTKKQRVYVIDGKKTLYTMYASTGLPQSATPHGVFHIQRERGYSFYNPDERMGAHYWTSFLYHGVYLFHSVPTNGKGQYIKSEALKLGKKPGSHGCVRLSVPDAKWINKNVPTGTKVIIN